VPVMIECRSEGDIELIFPVREGSSSRMGGRIHADLAVMIQGHEAEVGSTELADHLISSYKDRAIGASKCTPSPPGGSAPMRCSCPPDGIHIDHSPSSPVKSGWVGRDIKGGLG